VSGSIGWWWPALAGIATIVAFAVGPTYSVAVPAATVAVVAASLTIVEVIVRQRSEAEAGPARAPIVPGGVRGALAGGEPGREDVVLTLDLLERKISRPDLPARTGPQVTAIVRRPAPEYRRYVAQRLDELEEAS